ncbi:pre-mRNA-processing factor 8 [Nematocida sp. AWRm80]|nr:pre-mRNA-processing factor 8 [Nematocida sp. AWRm80]
MHKGPVEAPEQYLEQILREPAKKHKAHLLKGLPVLPSIISSLLQTFPMPWEDNKLLKCTYTVNGLVLKVKGVHTESRIRYICNWMHTLNTIDHDQIEYKRKKHTLNDYIQSLQSISNRQIYLEHSESNKTLFPILTQKNQLNDVSRPKIILDSSEEYLKDIVKEYLTDTIQARETIEVIVRKPSKNRKSRRVSSESNSIPNSSKNINIVHNDVILNNIKTTDVQDKYINSKSIRQIRLEPDFYSTIEWTKLTKLITLLARRILNYVLEEKQVSYLQVNEDNRLVKKRPITTKEKKKSRMGTSYCTVRELIKLLEALANLTEKYQEKSLSRKEYMRHLMDLFSSIGTITGIYKYKYTTMKQILQTKSILAALTEMQSKYSFPYTLLWCESWSIWCMCVQGLSKILTDRLAGYVSRRINGRENRKKPITKQRTDSNRDREQVQELITKVKERIPGLSSKLLPVLCQKYHQSWKYWKEDIPVGTNLFSKKLIPRHLSNTMNKAIIEQVSKQALFWITDALDNWEALSQSKLTDKKQIDRVQAKMLRIHMKIKKQIELDYTSNQEEQEAMIGTYIKTDKKSELDKEIPVLDSVNNTILCFNLYPRKTMLSLLDVSLRDLIKKYNYRLRRRDIEDLEYLKQAQRRLPHILDQIQMSIQSSRNSMSNESASIFTLSLLEGQPIYTSEIQDKVTDKFLNTLLWYHSRQIKILSANTLPTEETPLPATIIKIGDKLKTYLRQMHTHTIDRVSYISITDYSALLQSVSHNQLYLQLVTIASPAIAKYIITRLKSVIVYKNIQYVNRVGLFEGLELYPFLAEYILSFIDKILYPTTNILSMDTITASSNTNDLKSIINRYKSSNSLSIGPDVIGYIRCGTTAYTLYTDHIPMTYKCTYSSTEKQSATLLVPDYNNLHKNIQSASPLSTLYLIGLLVKRSISVPGLSLDQFKPVPQYKKDHISFLEHQKTQLQEYVNRLTDSNLEIESTNRIDQNIISKECNNSIRPDKTAKTDYSSLIRPIVQCIDSLPVHIELAGILLSITHKKLAIQSTEQTMNEFKQEISRIVQNSVSGSFYTISQRWNKLILRTILFFRNGITKEFMDLISRSEYTIHRCILGQLNTQVKSRLPNQLLYTDKSEGGLNLLSFKALYSTIRSWTGEIEQSDVLYKRIDAFISSRENIEDKMNILAAVEREFQSEYYTGIPRLHVFINQPVDMEYRVGWRLQAYLRNKNKRWTDEQMDGQWVEWKVYKKNLLKIISRKDKLPDANSSLLPVVSQNWKILSTATTNLKTNADTELNIDANINNQLDLQSDIDISIPIDQKYISTHQLIGNISKVTARQTQAQIRTRARIPNRMFTLWWSPIINRTNISISHPIPIDNTLITVKGNITSLKVSYLKMFSDSLWKTIHKEIIHLVYTIIDNNKSNHRISNIIITDTLTTPVDTYAITKLSNYRSQNSLEYANVLKPSIVGYFKDAATLTDSFWITIRLRWSDIDSTDILDEAEEWNSAFISAYSKSSSTYSKIGILLLVDLSTSQIAILPTHPLLDSILNTLHIELPDLLRQLSSLKILQTRTALLTGYNQSSLLNTAVITSPKELFNYPDGIYVNMHGNTLYGLNIHTGECYRVHFDTTAKITTIFAKLFLILDRLSIRYIYANKKLKSLFTKSGKSYLFLETKLDIPLHTIPETITNLYTHQTNTHPLHSLSRAVLILRHSTLCTTDTLKHLCTNYTTKEWQLLEHNLLTNILDYYKNTMNIKGTLQIDKTNTIDILINILFTDTYTRQDIQQYYRYIPDWNRYIDQTERVKIAGILNPYQSTPDLSTTAQSLKGLPNYPQTINVSDKIIQTIISISDPLTPITGILLLPHDLNRTLETKDILIIPRQIFIPGQFELTIEDNLLDTVTALLPHKNNQSKAYHSERILALIQTITPFTNEPVLTYSGIDLKEQILLLTVDLCTGELSGYHCITQKTYTFITLAPTHLAPVTSIETDPVYLSDTHWNTNIHFPKDTSPKIVLSSPGQFYDSKHQKPAQKKTKEK